MVSFSLFAISVEGFFDDDGLVADYDSYDSILLYSDIVG